MERRRRDSGRTPNKPHGSTSGHRKEGITMWWVIGIIGAVCFAIFLLFVWAKSVQAIAVDREFVLERIAKEYLARRQKGETMDQIQDALYNHYSISKPVEFWIGYYNPLPFGNLTFAGVTKQMPEELYAWAK